MRPALPAHLSLVNQSEVNLIRERGGLQRVAATLLPHVAVGQMAQLRVDQRDQLFERRLIALAPVDQQLGDVG